MANDRCTDPGRRWPATCPLCLLNLCVVGVFLGLLLGREGLVFWVLGVGNHRGCRFAFAAAAATAVAAWVWWHEGVVLTYYSNFSSAR